VNDPNLSEKWRESIAREDESLIENDVYEVVDRPPDDSGIPILGTRYTFRVKENSDGTVSKLKSRFIVQGYMQEYMVNYHLTFAPVARGSSVRVVFAISAHLGWRCYQQDVVTAFLFARVDTDIYVEPSEGSRCPPGKCWKLKRALYGLKQSPRLFYKDLTTYLLSIGFTRSTSDPCLYLRHDAGGKLDCLLAVYVDDTILAPKSESVRVEVQQQLEEKYKMTDLGELSWYLGMKVEQKDDCTTISQELYALKVLEELGMAKCNPTRAPGPEVLPSADDCPATEEEKQEMTTVPYRKAIGMLMYLSVSSRPDLSFMVHRMARYVSNPGMAHWGVVKHILRYLRGTTKYGLRYYKDGSITLTGFVDASWGDKDIKRYSTTGFVFIMCGGPVSWSSYAQKCISRSSTEAEYIALSDAVREGIWLRRLCNEAGAPQPPTILFEDNTSCITLAFGEQGSEHKKLKHVEIRYHFFREHVEAGTFVPTACKTQDQGADVLTKSLGWIKHQRMCNIIGVGRV